MPRADRSAIVLTIDGLHSGFLGAYGNTWIETPEFDALAAESFVFDQAIVAHPELDRVLNALWPASLLAHSAVPTCLVTDDPAAAGHPLAAGFGECILLPAEYSAVTAAEIEETGLAQTFAAFAERIAAIDRPQLLWLHTRGLTAPWDAPQELRRQYADPEDPPTPEFAELPDLRLTDDFDPDELLGIVHAYAGQVSLLDLCLGAAREALAESPAAASTLVFVCSEPGRFP